MGFQQIAGELIRRRRARGTGAFLPWKRSWPQQPAGGPQTRIERTEGWPAAGEPGLLRIHGGRHHPAQGGV